MPLKNKPPLSDLQHWMRGVLTHPDGVAAALNKKRSRQGLLTVIGETPAVSRVTRLSIYGNGYFARIVEAMGANFSSVKNVLGEKTFDTLARNYLVRYPSTFKSIDDVGHRFADFLLSEQQNKSVSPACLLAGAQVFPGSRTWTPAKGLPGRRILRNFPFVPELAELEWAAHQSFFADDFPALDPNSLKKIPKQKWLNARLTLDSAVKFMTIHWPIDDLWRKDGKYNRKPLPRFKTGPITVMIFRRPQDKWIRISRLMPAQASLLTNLQKGMRLGKALASLSRTQSKEQVSEHLEVWFRDWVGNGVIQKVCF